MTARPPIALAAITLFVCACAALASDAPPAPATVPAPPAAAPPAPPTAAARAQPAFEFLSPRRASVLLDRGGLQSIDARPLAKYLAGHIPGAIHLEDELLREPAGALPAQLLPRERLADLFGRAGIHPTTPALVYADHDDPLQATLIAYALLKAGHPAVRVLDGGFTAWHGTAPTTQKFAATTPHLWPAPSGPDPAAALADIRTALDTKETELIDARPPKFYRGETKAWERNGHIPGAISFDWHQLVTTDNESLLRPASEIAKLLDATGAERTNDTIVYCGTGREATFLYLYLRHAAKWPRVRLYESSWTEYQSMADLPVETGTEASMPTYSDGEMSTSGQPTGAMLRDLADRGVALIINCRTPGETRKLEFSEASLAASLGMKYEEIPLGGTDGYDPADVDRLHEILTRHGGTANVHMHCAGGPRAATLWAAYLVRHRDLTPADAMDRVRKAGMLRETSLERLLGRPLTVQAANADKPGGNPAPGR